MASCAYILRLGKRHYRYAPSSYQVCITPTQAQKLFGSTTKPEPLGCGVFACVFQHKDSNKVVKITRDESDVAGLQQAQGSGAAPELYEDFELAGRPRWMNPRRRTESWQEWPDQPRAFALVLEKLEALHGPERAIWNRRIAKMLDIEKRAAQAERQQQSLPHSTPNPSGRTATYHRKVGGVDTPEAACPKAGADAAHCRSRLRELNRLRADLAAIGVDWTDIHAGNIGKDSRGNWKILDLGASTTTLDRDLPVLEGAKKRRRR